MKRSKVLLVGGILGLVYAAYIVYYCFFTLTSQTDSASIIGTGIGIALITPHMIFVVLAVIFNWLGWGGRYRWAALVSGILYTVAAVAFILYAPFVIIQLILAFVGFANLKKIKDTSPKGSE